MKPRNVGAEVDAVTILRIKADRLTGAKREMVKRELIDRDFLALWGVPLDLADKLTRINAELWDLEDDIRARQADCRFDAAYHAISCQISRLNDERAAVKRAINEVCGSELREVKSHVNT